LALQERTYPQRLTDRDRERDAPSLLETATVARLPGFSWRYSRAQKKGAIVLESTIDVHIKTLRKKLGASDLIEAVRGVGYRFRETRD
jgi:hypothetical protein